MFLPVKRESLAAPLAFCNPPKDNSDAAFDVTWKGFFWVSPNRRHRPIRSEDPNVLMLVNLTQTSQHRQRQNLVLVTWRPPRNQLRPDGVFVSHMGLPSQIGRKMNGRVDDVG